MQKAEQFSEAQQKVHHQLDQRKLDDEKRVVVAQQLREEIAIIQQNLTDTTKSEQSIATRTKVKRTSCCFELIVDVVRTFFRS